jgi:hypothetical protein
MKVLVVGADVSQFVSGVRLYCDLSVFGHSKLPIWQTHCNYEGACRYT